MNNLAKVAVLLLAFLWMLVCIALAIHFGQRSLVHAQETQEVKPYVFAELPHGRIYKTVHEGCELFIVETRSDWEMAYRDTNSTYNYAITTGRGCK